VEATVTAYKFLRSGGVAPFTGFAWEPGAWVEAPAADPCRAGVHACRFDQLPYWLGAELWEVELDGGVVEQERKLVAPRGRLVRRIDGWNDDTAGAFRDSCVERARKAAPTYADDVAMIAESGRTALTAFVGARGAEMHGGRDAYFGERKEQADWLASRLGLGGDGYSRRRWSWRRAARPS
jgi:hypothetical protein